MSDAVGRSSSAYTVKPANRSIWIKGHEERAGVVWCGDRTPSSALNPDAGARSGVKAWRSYRAIQIAIRCKRTWAIGSSARNAATKCAARRTDAASACSRYSAERQGIAKELIDVDGKFAKMFSARPKTSPDDAEGVDPAEFQRYFVQQGRFTAGTATHYAPSTLTGDGAHRLIACRQVVDLSVRRGPIFGACGSRHPAGCLSEIDPISSVAVRSR